MWGRPWLLSCCSRGIKGPLNTGLNQALYHGCRISISWFASKIKKLSWKKPSIWQDTSIADVRENGWNPIYYEQKPYKTFTHLEKCSPKFSSIFNLEAKPKKWCGGYVISSSYDSSCWPYLHHLASSTHSKDLLGLGKKENHTSTIGFYEIMHCKTPTSLLTVSLEISQAALEVFSVTSARKSQPHQHAVCCHHPGAKKKTLQKEWRHTKELPECGVFFTTCFFQRHGVKICATVSVNSKPWLCHTCFKGF